MCNSHWPSITAMPRFKAEGPAQCIRFTAQLESGGGAYNTEHFSMKRGVMVMGCVERRAGACNKTWMGVVGGAAGCRASAESVYSASSRRHSRGATGAGGQKTQRGQGHVRYEVRSTPYSVARFYLLAALVVVLWQRAGSAVSCTALVAQPRATNPSHAFCRPFLWEQHSHLHHPSSHCTLLRTRTLVSFSRPRPLTKHALPTERATGCSIHLEGVGFHLLSSAGQPGIYIRRPAISRLHRRDSRIPAT